MVLYELTFARSRGSSFQTIENHRQGDLTDKTGVMWRLISESAVTSLRPPRNDLSNRFWTDKSMIGWAIHTSLYDKGHSSTPSYKIMFIRCTWQRKKKINLIIQFDHCNVSPKNKTEKKTLLFMQKVLLMMFIFLYKSRIKILFSVSFAV